MRRSLKKFRRRYRLFCLLLLLSVSLFGQDTLKTTTPDSLKKKVVISDDDKIGLLNAAFDGDSVGVMKYLNKGVDVNTKSHDGITPLMYASQNGFKNIVIALIERGADVNAKPVNKVTPLIGASQANQIDVVEILILNGADINAKDEDSISALLYAAAYDYFIMLDMLIFYGADLSHRDKLDNDAITLATYNNNPDIVDLLIQNGADVNSRSNKKFTPVMIAAQNGNYDILKLLIDNGADIDLKNIYKLSAISIATINRNEKIVKYLIEKGADLNPDILPSTSLLTLSRQFSTKEIRKELQKSGAKPNLRPVFYNISAAGDYVWNFNDIMLGMNAGIHEAKYGAGFYAGFDVRPTANRILVEKSDDIYYQFWENRYFLFLGMDKKFQIFRLGEYTNGGLFIGVKEIYTYGKYRATEMKPESEFLFVPQAGFYWLGYEAGFKVNYEYMDLGIINYSPHKINITLMILFDINKKQFSFKNKRIKWLD